MWYVIVVCQYFIFEVILWMSSSIAIFYWVHLKSYQHATKYKYVIIFPPWWCWCSTWCCCNTNVRIVTLCNYVNISMLATITREGRGTLNVQIKNKSFMEGDIYKSKWACGWIKFGHKLVKRLKRSKILGL